jgi:hypothetical protein
MERGPGWLLPCGWATAALGFAGALVVGIPWLWRVMA